MPSDNPPSVNNTRNPSKDGQANVDNEIAVAARFEEDGQRREELSSLSASLEY